MRNLVFNGTLHIVLTPLLNSLPVIGAVHVCDRPSARPWLHLAVSLPLKALQG